MNTFNTPKTAQTTNVWLTPRYVLDLLGQFDVDPCAATVRPWDCARINYTEADNGLSQEPLFGHRRGKTVFLVFMKSTPPPQLTLF